MNYFSCLDHTVVEVEPGVNCYSKRAGLRLTVHRRIPSIKNLFSEKSSSNSKFAVNGTFSNAGKYRNSHVILNLAKMCTCVEILFKLEEMKKS